ncbi:hypothetical protein P168DRAFT_317211 [Aspergillus campestris IBT 28561]|uniref:Uncharacterized protein n=1 Tax=Aspergillus campestris (strain IBT 28561) TaxID=1392248 RepID=A0A2I1D741_ASPC2|nr:uncharacterized protein P168DRAFT_317211 [Aspergillus campestris IBT 28561]PKY05688.1 hypothetical protein P168DRAFT_317211 [Aspergillus campestris IBT 28561]
MLAPKFLLLLLTLLLGVVFARDATGLSLHDKRDLQARQDGADAAAEQAPRPDTALSLRRDETIRPPGQAVPARRQDSFLWSGAAQLPGPPSDKELVAMTRDAYDLMIWYATRDKVPESKRPGSMTGLAVDNKVYFFSSLKGSGLTVYADRNNKADPKTNPNVPAGVQEALWNCYQASEREAQDAGEGDGQGQAQHRTGASCGEVMASWAFYSTNPGANLESATFVAWGAQRGRDGRAVYKIMPPCGGGRNPEWGCDSFLKSLDARAVGRSVVPADSYAEPTAVLHFPLRGFRIRLQLRD